MWQRKTFLFINFFVIKYFRFRFIYVKTATQPWKMSPPFFQQPPLKIEIRSEISNFIPPFWKFGRRFNRKRGSHHEKSQWYSHRPHIFNALVCNEVKINELYFRIQFVCSIFIWFLSLLYHIIQVRLKSPALDVLECLSHALFLN